MRAASRQGGKKTNSGAEMEHLKASGLIVIKKMHSVGINTILGRQGRDENSAMPGTVIIISTKHQ